MTMKSITKEEFKAKIQDVLVVQFSATWCGPCKALSHTISSIEADLVHPIYKMDIDDCSSLASALSIRSVPTLIRFEQGEEARRLIGNKSAEEIKDLAIDGPKHHADRLKAQMILKADGPTLNLKNAGVAPRIQTTLQWHVAFKMQRRHAIERAVDTLIQHTQTQMTQQVEPTIFINAEKNQSGWLAILQQENARR